MTLPRRQRRLLRSIGKQLSSSDPQFARQLEVFGEFAGPKPMPISEHLPAETSRFWSALWAALGAGPWLMPGQYPATDAVQHEVPHATFAPGLPAPGPRSRPAHSRRPGKPRPR